jgi:HPt (histidine-containing phosphotransfer) domain-containing protein
VDERAEPVDLDILREVTDGDAAFERELLQMFATDCAERLTRLERAVEAQDDEAIRREAHTIKGAAANIGAEQLRRCALDLERAGGAQKYDFARQCFSELRTAFDEVRLFIERYLAS